MKKQKKKQKMECVSADEARKMLDFHKHSIKMWTTKLAIETKREACENKFKGLSKMKEGLAKEMWGLRKGDVVMFHPNKVSKKTFIIGKVDSFAERDKNSGYVFVEEVLCICESGKEVKKRSDKYDLVGTSYDLTKSWFVHRADITKVKDVEAAKLGAVM